MSSSFAERKTIILEMLMEESSVSVSELARHLNVTVVTARADLAALEAEGLLVRTHGGAVPAQHPKIVERMQTDKGIKSSIAKAPASIKQGFTANSVESADLVRRYGRASRCRPDMCIARGPATAVEAG